MKDPFSLSTFCLYPFIGLNFSVDGSLKPCCRYKGSFKAQAEPFSEIRQKMLSGERVSGCEKCYLEEERGQKSMRQSFTETYSSTARLGQVQALEVALSNVCNFRCRMCNPQSSSAWRPEWKKLFPNAPQISEPRNGHTMTSLKATSESLKNIRKVKLVGGEPFLSKELEEFLSFILNVAENPVKLQIATNGSLLPSQPVIGLLKQFQEVRILLSIDAIGSRAEYIRKGCHWSELEENINKLKSLADKLEQTHIVSFMTLQAYNADSILDIYQWSQKMGLLFKYNVLRFPEFLRVEALTSDRRKQIWKHYQRSCTEPAFIKLLTPLENLYCDTPSIKNHQFIEFTKRLDVIRNETGSELFYED